MKKFSCACGKNVRDVYYQNGKLMCVKCFTQSTDHPHDFVINMLAARGFVITFKNEPVLVMKQFSADQLDSANEITTPNEDWLYVSGDTYWSHFSGSIDNLRCYITDYGRKSKTEEKTDEVDDGAASSCSASSCSSCSSCSGEED